MDSKETGSNSYPESDSLLNQMEAKTPRCKDDVEITYGKSFRENSIRRCSRQISSETWFLILTILGKKLIVKFVLYLFILQRHAMT